MPDPSEDWSSQLASAESVTGVALARPTSELRYSGPVNIGLLVYGQLDQVSGGGSP